MTHTAGFEEQVKGIITDDPRQLPLGDAAQALDADAHLPAGHDPGLFELRDRRSPATSSSASRASRSTTTSRSTSSRRSA